MARFRDWAQLVRIPNTLTAVADIFAGAAIVCGSSLLSINFGLLALSSIALYWSGMAWNDVFDVEEDRKNGRNRPISSGRMTLAFAWRMAGSLTVCGILLALVACWNFSERFQIWPAIVAIILVVSIFAYDLVLKKSPLAAWMMGLCRGCNMMLGATLGSVVINSASISGSQAGLGLSSDMTTQPWWEHKDLWIIAAGHSLYVTGFTIAARRESTLSPRWLLASGWLVALVGGIGLGLGPRFADGERAFKIDPSLAYPLLIGLLLFPVARRAIKAIEDPIPANVQASIKLAIMTIILLDASVTLQYAGTVWGSVCALMIFPSWWMGRWFRST